MSGAILPPGHEVSGAPAPSVPVSYVAAVPGKSGIPDWLSPLLQGVTLLSVIAIGFAAGVWKGQIDTRLDDVLRVGEEQRMKLSQLSQQVAELGKSISYLQGYLQDSRAEGSHVPSAKAHR